MPSRSWSSSEGGSLSALRPVRGRRDGTVQVVVGGSWNAIVCVRARRAMMSDVNDFDGMLRSAFVDLQCWSRVVLVNVYFVTSSSHERNSA